MHQWLDAMSQPRNWLGFIITYAFYLAWVVVWGLRSFETGPQAEDDWYEAPSRADFHTPRDSKRERREYRPDRERTLILLTPPGSPNQFGGFE